MKLLPIPTHQQICEYQNSQKHPFAATAREVNIFFFSKKINLYFNFGTENRE